MYVYTGSSWVITTNYNNVTAPYTLAQDLNADGNDITAVGKIGIGTTSPATALHVFSGQADEGLRVESTDQYADIHLKDNGGSSYIRNSNGSLILEASRANASNGTSTIFQLDGSEMMRIIQLGNVGIEYY